MNWQRLSNAGLKLGLATDVAGGFNRSMVREAQAMLMTARQFQNWELDAGHCWWQITEGNAIALGRKNLGKIEIGAKADLLYIEPNIPWQEAPKPLTQLLFGWDDRWLKKTWVGGVNALN